MKQIRASILALFVAAVSIPEAIAEDTIVIAAQETEILVAPRSATRRLVSMPALKFGLHAALQCAGEAESLTLSVADTFSTMGKDELIGKRSVEVELTVPARQVALAASSNFCIANDEDSASELLVPGLATAHASLHCAREDKVNVRFASAPLKVRLLCAREPDQELSPDR